MSLVRAIVKDDVARVTSGANDPELLEAIVRLCKQGITRPQLRVASLINFAHPARANRRENFVGP
jgi:hypothetical protein